MKSQDKYDKLMKALKEFYADGYQLMDGIDLASDMCPNNKLTEQELDGLHEITKVKYMVKNK